MTSKRMKTPYRYGTPLKKSNSFDRDIVHVFCRIRPSSSEESQKNIMKISDNVVQFSQPYSCQASRNAVQKLCQFTFSSVLGPESDQAGVFQKVCLPLVENFAAGKNGILFTYGVTGSGKTYTMTGTEASPGILSRTLDAVFNSIGTLQTKRFAMVPDTTNGFEVLTSEEAFKKRMREPGRIGNKRKGFASRLVDKTKVPIDEEGVMYAVFVTCTEVYNNYVYDLLEDFKENTMKRNLQPKALREDCQHNMYVFGATEVEVKSTEEALLIFEKGLRKRKIGHTALNTESSRSHSVFNIRLVQVPSDEHREVRQDMVCFRVSQLSLVDLAGSERTVRARTAGARLREAGNINSSLMALRACIEVLRENQMNNTNRLVPYRDCKLTMLFKTYFEGGGCVRMLVCVDPCCDSYDETLQVMKFAELTQEVQVIQPPVVEFQTANGPTPLKRPNSDKTKYCTKAKLFKPVGDSLAGPAVPSDIVGLIKSNPNTNEILDNLIRIFEKRSVARKKLTKRLHSNCTEFREALKRKEEELAVLNRENRCGELELKDNIISSLENECVRSQMKNYELLQQLDYFESNAKALEKAVEEKDMILTRNKILEQKERYKLKLHYENEAARKEEAFKALLKDKMKVYQENFTKNEEKLRKVKELVSDVTSTSSCKLNFPGGDPVNDTFSVHNDSLVSLELDCTLRE